MVFLVPFFSYFVLNISKLFHEATIDSSDTENTLSPLRLTVNDGEEKRVLLECLLYDDDDENLLAGKKIAI